MLCKALTPRRTVCNVYHNITWPERHIMFVILKLWIKNVKHIICCFTFFDINFDSRYYYVMWLTLSRWDDSPKKTKLMWDSGVFWDRNFWSITTSVHQQKPGTVSTLVESDQYWYWWYHWRSQVHSKYGHVCGSSERIGGKYNSGISRTSRHMFDILATWSV